MKVALVGNYPNRTGYIKELLDKVDDFDIDCFELYSELKFPDTKRYDFFVLSGGALGIYEKEKYPYIVPSLEFVRDLIKEDRPVLGICFGHQQIAEAIGGVVKKSETPEYGWTQITALPDSLFSGIPRSFHSFEYHNDEVVSVPSQAEIIAYSDRCRIQSFKYGSAYGIQFHPEVDQDLADKVLGETEKNYSEDISKRIISNFIENVQNRKG